LFLILKSALHRIAAGWCISQEETLFHYLASGQVQHTLLACMGCSVGTWKCRSESITVIAVATQQVHFE